MAVRQLSAENYRRFAIAVNSHDRENPTHSAANGIALNQVDIHRLDLEVGEEILPGITIHEDEGTAGSFRVLCDSEEHTLSAAVEERDEVLVT